MRNIVRGLSIALVGLIVLTGCSPWVGSTLPEGLPEGVPYVSDTYLMGEYSTNTSEDGTVEDWFIKLVSEEGVTVARVDKIFADAGFVLDMGLDDFRMYVSKDYFVSVFISQPRSKTNNTSQWSYDYSISRNDNGYEYVELQDLPESLPIGVPYVEYIHLVENYEESDSRWFIDILSEKPKNVEKIFLDVGFIRLDEPSANSGVSIPEDPDEKFMIFTNGTYEVLVRGSDGGNTELINSTLYHIYSYEIVDLSKL